MIEMFDTVTPSAIGRLASTSSDAVAGYVDGRYKDLAQLERDYPAHRHMGIAVRATDDAECLDVETGDAQPWQVAGWVLRQHSRGIVRPCIYANLSTMPAVKRELATAGIARQSVRLWVAAYDNDPSIPAGYDAHQWTDHWDGRNVDASVCLDDFFSHSTPVGPTRRRPPVRRRVVAVVRRAKPHPKVAAAGVGGGSGVGLTAVLAGLGVHLSSPAWAAISVALGLLAGWLRPAAR